MSPWEFVIVVDSEDVERVLNVAHIAEISTIATGGAINLLGGDLIVVDEPTRYALVVYLRTRGHAINVKNWLELRKANDAKYARPSDAPADE